MITMAPISKTGAFKEEMKMRKSKLIRLAFLCAAFCLTVTCAVLFGGTTNAVSARAEATTSSTFEVSVGASVRLSESTGLRFIVKMDETLAAKIKTDDNIALKFLISPQYYFNKITDGDYKKLEKKVEITVDKNKIYAGSGEYSGYYLANGVISEIKSQNRQIEFNAVAYYEENGSTVYSAMPENNERSFYYVTNKAFILGEQRYADLILSLNSYDWYGKADAPVSVTTDEEYEAIAERINSGALDLDNMNVTVGESVNRVTEITVKKYKYGDTIYDSMPTGVAKESDEKNHYDFKGWKLAANSLTVYEPEFTAVAHSVKEWNTENAEYDVAICHCGKTLAERFDKVVTDERQDVILTDGSKAITLGGISAYKSIKSIKYGEIDLGTDISALAIPEEMNNAVHGEQTLTVVVTDDYDLDHTIEVPVTIITKVISDWGSLLYNCQYNTVNSANGVNVFGAGKYYILGQDIEGSSVYSFSYGGSPYTIAWGGYEKGFAGTLDGRGKTIKNVNVNNGGIFSALYGGTVKNVKVTVAEWSDAYNHFSLFASNVKDTTFSNITITFNKVINLTKPGVLAGQQMFNTRCSDVTIYAYGSELGYLLGSAVYADNANNVCDNVFVYAKSLTKISPNQTAKTGVLVTLTKDLTKNNDVILKDKGGDKTSFTIDLENYSDYTVTNVGFDGKAVEFNGTTIAITDEMRNGIHGENSLTVTAVKGNDTVILAVPVTIVTESISTFDRLKELVSIKTTTDAADIKKGKDKYYVLAGDINAGQYAAGAGGSNATYAGFAGTLDGRGHKLIGGTTGGHGLFGGLYGGTIKNITFEGVTYGGTRWNSLIANNIFGATMENVTITVANELDMSGIDTDLAEAEWNNRGLIAFGHTQGLKMTNVTIEAKNAKLFTLFGTGSLSCQKGQYTCDRVNVIVKGLKYLGRTASSSLGINEVSNLTVTIAE